MKQVCRQPQPALVWRVFRGGPRWPGEPRPAGALALHVPRQRPSGPLALPLLPGKGTHRPRRAAAVAFGGRDATRRQAKVGGYPPTQVKEEGWAKPGPGDMEWEGTRRPWHARVSSAEAGSPPTASSGRSGPLADSEGTGFISVAPPRIARPCDGRIRTHQAAAADPASPVRWQALQAAPGQWPGSSPGTKGALDLSCSALGPSRGNAEGATRVGHFGSPT